MSYDWLSPEDRKERINQLEDWIHRPPPDNTIPDKEFGPPQFVIPLADLGEFNEAEVLVSSFYILI